MNPKSEVKDVFEKFLLDNGLSYAKAAEQFESHGRSMSRQSLWKMVSNGSLKLSVFLELLGYNKAELKIETLRDEKNKKRGYGNRVVRNLDGKIYDTWKCSALSSSFYSDGVHKYDDHLATELYINDSDTSILVHYCDDEYALTEEGKCYPWMEIIDSDQRAEFVKKYGVL